MSGRDIGSSAEEDESGVLDALFISNDAKFSANFVALVFFTSLSTPSFLVGVITLDDAGFFGLVWCGFLWKNGKLILGVFDGDIIAPSIGAVLDGSAAAFKDSFLALARSTSCSSTILKYMP